MDDLLKEAIADAKAVRETALANAKVALEEAFTPRLKSMLSKKIQHEMEDVPEDDDSLEEPVAEEAPLEDEDDALVPDEDEGGPDHVKEEDDAEAPEEDDAIAPEEDDAPADDKVSEQEDVPEDDAVAPEEDDAVAPEDDELDLEAILRELEEEDDEEDGVSEEYNEDEVGDGEEEVPAEDQPDANVAENDVSSDIGKADNKVADKANDSSATSAQGPEGEGSDSPAGKENSDDEVVDDLKESSDDSMAPPAEDADVDIEQEDIDLEEVLKALSEEDDAEKEDDGVEENAQLKKEIKEHRDVVKYLRAKLNEVNLLNAKLLFSNKLFRAFGLTNEQKMKVVETFDRAHNLREIKLVYSTLAESFQGRKAVVKESKGSSSKAVASTKPSKKVISEGSDIKARFQKLANIL